MKLKRIISALIVFTMVMACAVCNVSAADGTYNVTTSYDVSTKNITVNAAIAGGTEGSMVSYMIVAPVTTGEGEEAVTSYDVQADGSNILHIDQATLNASGAATMDEVTAAYSYFKGGKVKFVSTDDTLTGLKADDKLKPHNYTQSVENFSDVLTGVTFVDANDNGQATYFYYVTTDGKVVQANPQGNLTAARWDQYNMAGWFDGSDLDSSTAKLVPIEGVAAYIVDMGNADESDTKRGSRVKIVYEKKVTSFDGTADKEQSFTIYDSFTVNEDGTPSVNLMVNGRYKEDVTDGKFGDIDLEPASMIALAKSNNPSTYDGETEAVGYMSIDAQPIYGEYTNSNGTFDAVTFLVTATSTEIADVAGLKITAYPKGTVSHDGTIADSSIEPVELGICPNAYTGQTKFAIQLFDGAKSGALDPEKWDIEATPVLNEGTADAPNWVELSVIGDNPASTGKYFDVDRTTTATEVVGE